MAEEKRVEDLAIKKPEAPKPVIETIPHKILDVMNKLRQDKNQLFNQMLNISFQVVELQKQQITISDKIKNNNEFPISIPVFRSSVFVTDGRQPFTMYVKPKNVSELPLGQVPTNLATIPAKTPSGVAEVTVVDVIPDTPNFLRIKSE